MKRYRQGSVHGRFQPLHNGHLKYVLRAKELCDFLWVGITQYNVNSLAESPKDRHRQESIHNPLTYFERAEMITDVLLDSSLKLSQFDIIPFPIERPECLPGFLPTTVPIFTTINDQWNIEKINTLRSIGYEVVTLWEDVEKEFNGMNIRKLICLGDETWKQQVPPATIRIIEKYGIRDRLVRLIGKNI
jgi:cytidyltransferase-like protein